MEGKRELRARRKAEELEDWRRGRDRVDMDLRTSVRGWNPFYWGIGGLIALTLILGLTSLLHVF